ncbi:hypothetical protein ACFLYN_02365 [Chloroflexota bacterium]
MHEKNANVTVVAEQALSDERLLSEILEGLKNRNETIRYNCHKVLMAISRERGEVLYPHWDYFVEQLDSSNTYHRLSSVSLLAVLAAVDKENKFDELFDKYFGLLGDKGTVLAMYVARNAGKIAVAKLHLCEEITDRLLDIDSVYRGKQLELTKSSIIEAFDEFYDESESKDRIIEFVSKQLDSESPKTRKAAKAFLNKWSQPV